MTTAELIAKIELIREYEAMRDEIDAVIDTAKDEIKQYITDCGVEEIEAGKYVARYTTVKTNRFDTTAFKRDHLDMYKDYTKLTTSRRFTISK